MAYSPSEKYPGAVDVDPDYQGGKFRDNNPSTTNNGSPLKAIDRNELLARDEAIMNDAGFEYSGVADTPQDSQLFKAYKASLGNGANLLSNHNFLIQTPDDSQPLPSATPTSYPPGYQIFSGVFANETTGITNLTYIDGRVSFSGGDLYFSVPNTGGVERLTEFAASVADFDGKPRTRGVSFALVGDEYRVTVTTDALEDVGAVLTPLGSVKFEQGSVATGHDVGALSTGNFSDYTDIVYGSVADMLAGNPLPAGIGDRCLTGATTWERVGSGSSLSDFTPLTDISILDFNVDKTGTNDSLQGFVDAVSFGGRVYSPEKASFYLSNIVPTPNSDTEIDLNNSTVIWRGAVDIGNNSRGFGIFDIKGSMSAMPVATVTSDMTVGSQSVALNAGHPFSVGDYIFIEALPTNDQTTGLFPKLGYLTRISNFDGNTAITDYKCAWNVPASTILIYSVSPIKNVSVKNVHLDDQMVATPSPDSDTTAPAVERNKAVMLVNMVDAINCHHENLSVDNGKFPMVLGKRVADCSVSRSEYNNPVWFAGGEGYGAAWINALRCDSIDLITRGDRHNTDYSTAAYCNVVRCTSSGSEQFSFTTHGAYEHDITWDQCSGFWFRPASAGFADYGNVLKNGYVKNSKFNNTGGQGINIQFENSQLGIVGGTYAKLSFLGETKTTDINAIRFDDRVSSGFVDAVLGDKFDDIFADSLSKLAFDASCDFTDGWDRIEVKGEVRGGGVTGQAEFRLDGVSESNFIDATFFKSRVRWSGVTNEISVTGSTVKNEDADGSPFFYTRDVSTDDVLMVDFSSNFITGNKSVGSSSRPVQFQSFAQTIATNLSITSANNTYKDCGGDAVFDGGGANYTISNAKIHKNNLVNSGDVLVIAVPDAGLYESGDVNPTKGSSGGPAVWDGTVWIDLT
ncbi:hypothetical protein NVP1005O_45 [Vibrio phage 1.005.O._10N.286.48.F2]|nr:hypothetical protein NVP1005O_45 [Vibrio phage 1.005.O._10N.286.48.F2]